MRFQCPKCQTLLEAPENLAGKKVACRCGHQMIAPKPRQQTTNSKPLIRAELADVPGLPAKDTAVSAPIDVQKPAGSIFIDCPCGKRLKAPSTAAGKSVRCPCGKILAVSGSNLDSETHRNAALPTHRRNATSERASHHTQTKPPSAPPPSLGDVLQEEIRHASESSARHKIHASSNPYAAPSDHAPDHAYSPTHSKYFGDAKAADIRRKYIRHEAAVRSIGIWGYLISSLLTLAVVSWIFLIFSGDQLVSSDGTVVPDIVLMGMALFFGSCACLGFFASAAIRKLKPWARIVITIYSGIGCLVGFPIGTLINGYILWLLHSEKGNFIFTPEYEKIRRRTADMTIPTSRILIVLVAILVTLVLCAILAPVVMILSVAVARR